MIERGDSEKAKSFWKFAEQVSEEVKRWPDWMADKEPKEKKMVRQSR